VGLGLVNMAGFIAAMNWVKGMEAKRCNHEQALRKITKPVWIEEHALGPKTLDE